MLFARRLHCVKLIKNHFIFNINAMSSDRAEQVMTPEQ